MRIHVSPITGANRTRSARRAARRLLAAAALASLALSGCAAPSPSTGSPGNTPDTTPEPALSPPTTTTPAATHAGGLAVGQVTAVPGSVGGRYLYYPAEAVSASQPRRLIIFVHGGNGHDGSIHELPWWIRDLTRSGWAVASLDYRRLAADPATATDVADGVRYLQTSTAITPHNTVLFGHSLGGRIAQLVAYGENNEMPYGAEVGRLLTLAPVHDVWAMAKVNYYLGDVIIRNVLGCNPGITNLGGFPTCAPSALGASQPRTLIDADDPSTFIGVFRNDIVVPPSVGANALAASLRAAGTPNTFVSLPGSFHDAGDARSTDPTQAQLRTSILAWLAGG